MTKKKKKANNKIPFRQQDKDGKPENESTNLAYKINMLAIYTHEGLSLRPYDQL